MSLPTAVVCSYYLPDPDQDSGSRRMMHLIQFLRRGGWQVSFLALNGIPEGRTALPLQRFGIRVYDGAEEDIEQIFGELRCDLALLAFWPLAEYLIPMVRRSSPTTRIVVDSVDLHFLRDARRVFHDASSPDSSGVLSEEYGAQAVGELNSYAAADGVLTVSQKEAVLLADLLSGHTPTFSVPDCEDFEVSPIPFAERRGMVSVGAYEHAPNIEALKFLCQQIVPRIDPDLLREHPIYIVGSGMNETVRRLGAGVPGVSMVGWVPSVEPYFARARVSVVPLLYGAGTKRKVVQALMTGTPSVVTSVGAEGLGLRHEEHALIRDDPGAFAAAMERLLTDEGVWTRLARAGRTHILAQHGVEAARDRFQAALEVVLGRPPKPAILPARTREHYSKRVNYQYFQRLALRLREALADLAPPGAKILVVTDGNEELLRLGAREGWHFPQREDGSHPGNGPADGAACVTALEQLRGRGASYLVLPHTALWWLNHYAGLQEYLDSRGSLLLRREDLGCIYRLDRSGAGARTDARDPLALAAPGDLQGGGGARVRLGERFPLVSPPGGVPSATRLIAFYLPQFHPIPENDEWWGEGFTEWRNVVRAQPLFPGHQQPKLPADLGYYDLRLPAVREAQADLARTYGIHGFCYYHYWFNGKRLLERPFSEVLSSGSPGLPFCLCWANEPWSRRWNGSEQEVLQSQSYSAEDDLRHIQALLPALADPRAIRVDGRPLFLIYQGHKLPDPARTVDLWRNEVDRAGLPGMYLMAVETGWNAGWDATAVGFDAKVLFQPQFSLLQSCPRLETGAAETLQVYDYQQAWPILANPEPVAYRRYDTVFPAWDNSARTGERGVVVHNSTPEAYEQWLELAITRAQRWPEDQRLVFINAWNEWAEGACLEPDARSGHAYLEATRRALSTTARYPRSTAGVPAELTGRR